MSESMHSRHFATSVVLAAALAAGGAAVAEPTQSAALQIYQQRTADGGIVLTDRPVAGAVTQRTWLAAREDAAAARQRREQARLDALAVSERIERQVEAQRQRDHEFALARLQLAQAEARLDAERARAEAAAQPAFVFVRSVAPRPFPRPPHVRPGLPRPRQPAQPGLGMYGPVSG